MILNNKRKDNINVVFYTYKGDSRAIDSVTVKAGKTKEVKHYKVYAKIYSSESILLGEGYFYYNINISEDKAEEEGGSYCVIC